MSEKPKKLKGLIKNVDQIKIPVDFVGIKKGKIHPTDIDVVLEFDDKHLILCEIKTHGAKIPRGQELVLERIVKAWCAGGGGKRAVAVSLAYELVDGPIIYLKDCKVISVFYGDYGEWYSSSAEKNHPPQTFLEYITHLAKKWDIKKMKFD